MAFRFEPSEAIADGVRRVAADRIAAAIEALDTAATASPDSVDDAIHEVRKRCKELRALARLADAGLGPHRRRFDRRIRDAARQLAGLRDVHAMLVTFDHLRAAGPDAADDRLEVVRDAQIRAARAVAPETLDRDPRVVAARGLLVEAGEHVARWSFTGDFDLVAGGLRETYRDGRRRLATTRADPGDAALHRWRKSVKDLWYQLRLLEAASPSMLGPLITELDKLGESLGDDHDLAVLVDHLRRDRSRYGGKRAVKRAVRLARDRQGDLRQRSLRLGATLYVEAPAAFVDRVGRYWATAQAEGPELATGGIAELWSDRSGPERDPKG